MKRILAFLAVFCISVWPAYSQAATKLRVLTAPGVNETKPKDWHNTLSIANKKLMLSCPKCSPIQVVTVPKDEVSELRYGQNAYHHWVSGIVTGVFSLGVGAIVGLMPHHQHFFSVDLKDGKVLGIQADKGDYRQIAGMLENFAGIPIVVTPKDAHYLNGFNTKVEATPTK